MKSKPITAPMIHRAIPISPMLQERDGATGLETAGNSVRGRIVEAGAVELVSETGAAVSPDSG